MTAQPLKRERGRKGESESLIAAFIAAMCSNGTVRINIQFQSPGVGEGG